MQNNRIWRFFFVLLFLQIVIDGFCIYFLFTFKMMHFIKDFLLILTFILFIIQEPFKDWVNYLGQEIGVAITWAMMFFMLAGILEIFNPYSSGLLRGLLGIKLMYVPWLIVPLAFAYFDTEDDVEKFLKILALFAIPINIFGLIQYAKGPNFMVATFGPGFAANTMMAMVFGYHETFVRIIGTFASSAHYGHFLTFNIIICFALFLSKSKPRWLWIAAISQSFFCLLCTGSRGALLSLIVMFVFFLAVMKQVRTILVAFLVFGGGLYLAFANLGSAVLARFQTVTKVSMVRERTIDMAPKMFLSTLEKYPLGKGIGSASQAARYLGKQEGNFALTESYPSKLLLETGVVGVFLFYFAVFLYGNRWKNNWARSFHGESKAFLFFTAFTAYLVGCIVGGSFPDAPPTSVYFWAALGILPRIAAFTRAAEQDELLRASEQEPPET